MSLLDIDGITIQGLRFIISAYKFVPFRWVTFQIEMESKDHPKGIPMVRFEWRPKSPHGTRIDMIPARGTRPRAASITFFVALICRPDPVESTFNTASAALVALTKADVEDVLKARFIIREALEKVADAKVWGC